MFTENRKAYFDYEILEKFEAGIELLGFEVKSVISGNAHMEGGRVLIRGGEAFLVGTTIPPYQPKNTPSNYEPDRTRKLLLTKKEISYLTGKTAEKGLTLLPLKVYTKHGLCKLLLGLGKGKKKTDKRETIKARESKRKIDRTLKGDA